MKKSLDKSQIKVLLLEGISQKAVDYFKAQGYENVELLPTALQRGRSERKDQRCSFYWGIRSRTHLAEEVLPRQKN